MLLTSLFSLFVYDTSAGTAHQVFEWGWRGGGGGGGGLKKNA